MFFSRVSKTKLLTGIAAFCAAAVLSGIPAYAQADAASETAEIETTEEGQEETAQEEQKTGSAASDFFAPAPEQDPLSEAKSSLVVETVDALQKNSGESQLARNNMDSLNSVVGNSHMNTEDVQTKVVVAAPNGYLNIHTEASLGSEIVGKLYSNDAAAVLQDDGSGWVKIRSGNVTGYVMGDYLLSDRESKLLTDIIAKDMATVDKDETAVYLGKDRNSGILCYTKSGEQLEVKAEEDGWLRVSTENGEGYIPADDANVAAVLPTAESAEDEADRLENSNVQDLLDHEKEKAEEAKRIAEAAAKQAERAEKNSDERPEELEAAQTAAEATQNAADNAQEQVEAAQVAVDESGREMGQAVADYAMQFLGNPYVWGGSSLTHGTDCSGFTMSVYAHFGVALAHYDGAQRSVGIGIPSLAEARPGDLICYYGHVGIYIGDGKIVHAANEQLGITIGAADHQAISAIRRIFY